VCGGRRGEGEVEGRSTKELKMGPTRGWGVTVASPLARRREWGILPGGKFQAGPAVAAAVDRYEGAGVGRTLAAAVVMFVLAILMGRLILAPQFLGSTGWAVFLVSLPILFILLALLFRPLLALILIALFAVAALAFRGLLSNGGWALLYLVPPALAASWIALRVVQKLRSQKVGEEVEKE
jgi:hypothetical protein